MSSQLRQLIERSDSDSLSDSDEPLLFPTARKVPESSDHESSTFPPAYSVSAIMDRPIKRPLTYARKMIPPNLEEYAREELLSMVSYEIRLRWKTQPWYDCIFCLFSLLPLLLT